MKHFLDELQSVLYDKRREKFKKLFIPMSIAGVVAILLAYYVTVIINYVEILSNLQHQQEYLYTEIQRLQEDNANLQKEYFELKNLEPER